MRRTLLTFALSLLIALPAAAQQPLKISFQNGRVSVDATSVPVRTILNEWAKQGGTKVVGAERISGAPLTLKLVNVTEAQALEVILRSVAGYMAAPRNAASTTGPSMYDRILVMATTSAPPPSAARPTPANNNAAFNGTQRFIPPRPQPQEQVEPDEPDDNPPNPPVFTFPQNGQQNGQANGFQQPQPFINAPVVQPQINGAPGAPITINPAPAPGQTMPFGASTPGVIVQPAPPVQQPGVKPPGNK
jgi:hypothetical protein